MFPIKENKHNFRQPEKFIVYPANTSRLGGAQLYFGSLTILNHIENKGVITDHFEKKMKKSSF